MATAWWSIRLPCSQKNKLAGLWVGYLRTYFGILKYVSLSWGYLENSLKVDVILLQARSTRTCSARILSPTSWRLQHKKVAVQCIYQETQHACSKFQKIYQEIDFSSAYTGDAGNTIVPFLPPCCTAFCHSTTNTWQSSWSDFTTNLEHLWEQCHVDVDTVISAVALQCEDEQDIHGKQCNHQQVPTKTTNNDNRKTCSN